MSKFATLQTARPVGPVTSTPDPTAATYEGGAATTRDAKSELWLLAVTNLVAEPTAYESARDRDDRYATLVAAVVADDPDWVAALVPWLRSVANLRSVAVVTAAEYVRAGGPRGRAVVAAALQRADEPAEMLAYWRARYGRSIPAAVKRGVADACDRLYTERAVLRYDGTGRPWRFGDVVRTVHPRPTTTTRSDVYRYVAARRDDPDADIPASLAQIAADRALLAYPPGLRRAAIGGATWHAAGWSWERAAGWLPGGLDAPAWEALIPSMGYMALLRNLRSFDTAGVSDAVAANVCARLADPDAVAASRQMPFRFYSAWREVADLRWAGALQRALDLSLRAVPALPGRTLVAVDVSGSMADTISARSDRARWELAALFGFALAARADAADVVLYSDRLVPVAHAGVPILRLVDGVRQYVGGGTRTWAALDAAYDGHDRVVVLTDEQAYDAPDGRHDRIPACYTFNLAGYRPGSAPSRPGWYTFGGLSDAAFPLIAALDDRRSGGWPHLS